MRVAGSGLTSAALLAACLAQVSVAGAVPYEQRSSAARAAYTSVAMVANVVPIVSAFFAPKCLPGYILCKASFAGISVLAAAAQFGWSGDSDHDQTRAILNRGFAGDWYLTGRHIAGDVKPEPLPEPPPPAADSGGGWQPPPR